jgi:HD superfamily phosphohydrolase
MPVNPAEKLRPARSVFDPLYGYIHLSESEFRVWRSPLFQRLGQIRQLGFVSVLFPSATHTRLSHSLGVLHIAQKMIDVVNTKHERRNEERLSEKEQALIRFAALLHDVGHLPFSHVGEEAYKDVLRPIEVREKKTLTFGEAREISLTCDELHEQISARIILGDSKEIGKAIESYNDGLQSSDKIEPKDVADVLRGTPGNLSRLTPFLKSGLDADRLDFLPRDSYFVGSKYGIIEQDTLIKKLLRIKNEDTYELCVEADAALIVDHFLLSRFYWYSVLLGYPRVIFLDMLTKNVMKYLVEKERICTIRRLDAITKNIGHKTEMHEFIELQDSQVVMAMRELHKVLDGKTDIDQKEMELDTSIKVLMGGNVSHMFHRQQSLMEQAQYRGLFVDENIESAEQDSTKELRKSNLIGERAFVKIVHKSRSVHKWIPGIDTENGGKFDESWKEEALIECRKKGLPPCLPLQLSDTNLTHRIGESRHGNEKSKALVNVNFAVFILEPGNLEQKVKINSALEEHFKELIQPFEEAIHGQARLATQTDS